jgi:hypothetical protein
MACLEWQRIPNDRTRRHLRTRRSHFPNRYTSPVNDVAPDSGVLFLHLCALYYGITRWLFLRDAGRKRTHMDRQLAMLRGCTRISGRTSPQSAGDRVSDGPDPRTFDTRQPGPSDRREADDLDPRDAFVSDLDLPHERERERVYVYDPAYALRDSEAGAVTTIGTLRAVPATDLRDDHGLPGDLRHGEQEPLHSAGLPISRVAPAEGHRSTTLVALTERGREFLQHHRNPDREPAQRFYAGPSKARELTYNPPLYRAFQRSDRPHARGARIRRVALDDDLKRQHLAFVRKGNREQPDSDGRPTRSLEEVHEWASTHELPVLDDAVQFGDLRIEYAWPDRLRDSEPVGVATPHYPVPHAAAKARSGFTCHRGSGPRVGGRSGRSVRGRRPFDPDLADEFL